MKAFRGTWIFAGLVALIAALVVWDYRRQESTEQAKVESAKLIPSFSLQDIAKVEFKSKLTDFVIENQGGSFKMLRPVKDDVEYAELESYLNGLSGQEAKIVTVEGAVKWDQYGLADPEFVLTMTDKQNRIRKLEVGTVRSFDDGFYVRRDGTEQLLVVSSSLASSTTRVANEFRLKDLYQGDLDIQGLDLLQKQTKLVFVKKEGRWSLDRYPDWRVSDSSLSEYFNILRHMKADSIVSDSGSWTEQGKYGLQKPEIVVQVKGASGKTWSAKLAAPKDQDVYVHVGDERPIYRIQKQKFESLRKAAKDFRDREFPFAFDHFAARKISIKFSGQQSPVEYLKKDGKWDLAVKQAHEVVDGAKVDEFLNEVRNLKVQDFSEGAEAKKSLPKMASRIELWNEKGDSLFSLSWGDERKTKGTETQAFLARSSLFSENLILEKAPLDRLEKWEFLQKPKVEDDSNKKPDQG